MQVVDGGVAIRIQQGVRPVTFFIPLYVVPCTIWLPITVGFTRSKHEVMGWCKASPRSLYDRAMNQVYIG